MAQSIVTLIPWLVVPVILIVLLIFSTIIVRRVKDPEARLSARGGFWAGFILFVIFMISQLRDVREPHFDFSLIPGLEFIPLIGGAVVGFALLWAVRALLPTRLVGVTTLLLTAITTTALYSFVFLESLRTIVLYAALGAALGVLVHITLFPSSIRNLWKPMTRAPSNVGSSAGQATDKPQATPPPVPPAPEPPAPEPSTPGQATPRDKI